MPIAPPRPCGQCGALQCTEHGRRNRPAWASRPVYATKRRTGRWLQARRRSLTLCALCLEAGRVEAATIRDHIVPLAEGGLDVDGNTQGLCADCHDRKTRDEARRGVRRWWEEP